MVAHRSTGLPECPILLEMEINYPYHHGCPQKYRSARMWASHFVRNGNQLSISSWLTIEVQVCQNVSQSNTWLPNLLNFSDLLLHKIGNILIIISSINFGGKWGWLIHEILYCTFFCPSTLVRGQRAIYLFLEVCLSGFFVFRQHLLMDESQSSNNFFSSYRAFRLVVRSSFVFASRNWDWLK